MFHTSASYDMVICDIDGCLSSEDTAPFDVTGLALVADHNRLAMLRRDRPIVTVCSGRPLAFAEAMCRLIHNAVVPCVAENGVWLWDPATNRSEADPAITHEQLAIVQEARVVLAERYASLGVTQQPGKSASVTLYHPNTAVLKSICPEVEALFNERGWPFRVSMTWFYINCDLVHVSKASGIRRLLAATGIDPARTAGIGDTLSDRPIAEAVAWFACPANAAANLQPLAAYVSPEAEVRGVVDILSRLSPPA